MTDKQLRIIDSKTGELITQGMEFTKTSLTIDPDTTYDSWEGIGEQLNQIEGAIQWWIGDWLNFGERKYGEMYAQISGTDLTCNPIKIQIKFDRHCHKNGLFLQTHERNPNGWH